MKKIDFNSALSTIMELAISQNNTLRDEQIHDVFDEILEDKAQYAPIYEYFKQRNIRIFGNSDDDNATEKNVKSEDCKVNSEKTAASDKKKSKKEQTEEEIFYDMYMKDVAKVRSKTSKQVSELLKKSMNGDKEARNTIIEHYLKLVITISEQFTGREVRTSDLVQEGNLALIECVDSYNGQDNFSQYLISHISQAMQNAIDEEAGSAQIGSHLVERVNALSDATTDLFEKLGREATLEEICQYMSLPEDEVRTAMKISLDALTINDRE